MTRYLIDQLAKIGLVLLVLSSALLAATAVAQAQDDGTSTTQTPGATPANTTASTPSSSSTPTPSSSSTPTPIPATPVDDAPTTTATDDGATNDTGTAPGECEQGESRCIKVDGKLTVTDYEVLEGGRIRIDLYADYPHRVAMAGAQGAESGASRLNQRTITVQEGHSSHTIDVREVNNRVAATVGNDGGLVAVADRTGGWNFSISYGLGGVLTVAGMGALLGAVGVVLRIQWRDKQINDNIEQVK